MAIVKIKMNRLFLFMAVVPFMMQGCFLQPKPHISLPERLVYSEYLSFIKLKETTKQEIKKRLGHPSIEFAKDNIQVFRLVIEEGQLENIKDKYAGSFYYSIYRDIRKDRYDLVVAYTKEGVVRKIGVIANR